MYCHPSSLSTFESRPLRRLVLRRDSAISCWARCDLRRYRTHVSPGSGPRGPGKRSASSLAIRWSSESMGTTTPRFSSMPMWFMTSPHRGHRIHAAAGSRTNCAIPSDVMGISAGLFRGLCYRIMVSERTAKVRRVGPASLAVVIPRDWCRGNRIGPGDLVLVSYNGEVHIRLASKEAAPHG